MADQKDNTFDKVVALSKRRGFVYPGSDIYGGLANTYDYGPAGAELLRNIRNLWWKNFVHNRSDMVGLDSSLISSHKVWEASGHATGFADAMLDCKNCKTRKRADHLIEDALEKIEEAKLKELAEKFASDNKDIDIKKVKKSISGRKVEGLSTTELESIINHVNIKCPTCGKFDWTSVRKFNLLFPVQLGIIEGEQSLAYLRGETAQGIFINFKNVVDSTRVRLPFGIAQLGKSFRNEITLGNFIFRTIEFEQGEIEFFFNPDKQNWEELFENWKNDLWKFITESLGIKKENLRWRAHTDEERSFYSKKTEDLEYNFPFGFKELWGLAYRTDYDLQQHIKYSGKDLSIVDPETNKKIIPHVIEPAVGINRIFFMILCDSYTEEAERVYLKLDPKLAPVKAAVFPLLANKPQLVEMARGIYEDLKKELNDVVVFDDRGNIGKRYFAQDEIGTPFCITVDFQSIEDKTVTVRERDSMKQERVNMDKLSEYIKEKLA